MPARIARLPIAKIRSLSAEDIITMSRTVENRHVLAALLRAWGNK
ncbi:hypothetical protein [Sansalvadorimonas verongulae]|nr:hypothetical protein [Sansalvadorimonas verongulae]